MNDPAKSRRSSFRRLPALFLTVGLAGYLAVCVIVAIGQRQIIYVPPHSTAEQVEAAAKDARMERWRDASGQAIGMKRMSLRQPATGQVLIVYGNASSATGSAHYADDIQSVAALDVFVVEYPGYADRAGSPTEKNLFAAADEAMQLLATNLPTYVLGESLGSGVAAYLAGTQPDRIAGLILLSPYDRLANVAQHRMPFLPARFLLIDQFPSADYLRNYRGPVAVMVDGRDDIVPEKFGRRLYDGYTGPKRLWQFPGGFHITIMEPPAQFWGEVLGFWQMSRNIASQKPGN
jgi:pimeloyl-ACP methyl ester carboxylesterase